MKFLHTADIHLDWKFLGIRDESKRRRLHQEHRDVFKQIVRVGLENKIDVMFIVGDLFEQSGFSMDTIRFIQRELECFKPTPVFIAPGNHDPSISGSPYLLDGWGDHVFIFHNNHFTSHSLDEHNAVIHGIAYTADAGEKNPLQDFQVNSQSKLNIVLLHGSDMHAVPDTHSKTACFPFSRSDLHNWGADYVALGHYHTCYFIPDNQPIAAYPGSPQGMSFSDLGERHVIVGELTKDENQLRKERVNRREYRDVTWDCTGCTTREEVLDGLRQHIDSEGHNEHILRIRLTGTSSPEIDMDLPSMGETLSEHCFQAMLINETSLKWDLEALRSQQNVRGEFVHQIGNIMEGSAEEEVDRYRAAMDYGLQALSENQEVKLR